MSVNHIPLAARHKAISGDRESIAQRVYLEFYHLKELPFSITPDPAFLYRSETYQKALEKILYGIHAQLGFLMLTGEVGAGKTTLCRSLLDELDGLADTVYIINPSLSGTELISCILDDFNIPYPEDASKKLLIDTLNKHLLARSPSQPVVIIIDDAQTMSPQALEDLRLLSNLETDKNKLLQMVLAGQPELLEMISQPEMRQLKQRIAVHCQLSLLTQTEVEAYIAHRLFIAGNNGSVRFDKGSIHKVHQTSKGIPRIINKMCDFALMAGYTHGEYQIGRTHIKAAITELIDKENTPPIKTNSIFMGGFSTPLKIITSAVLLVAMLWAGLFYYQSRRRIATVSPQGETIPSARDTRPVSLPEKVNASPAAATKAVIYDSHALTGPYVLLIASYNTLESTLRAVRIYQQKGISVSWNSINLGPKGTLYRLFSGRYATPDEAFQFRGKHHLNGARALKAPWTVMIKQNTNLKELETIQAQIEQQKIDTYIMASPEGRYYLLSGAYVSKHGAQEMVHEIHQKTNITSFVVKI